EDFFEPLKSTVNDLKIRCSIGQTRLEQGVSIFGFLSGYHWKQGGAVLDGDYYNGLRPRGLPVDNLSWVKNTNYNIVLDLAMLQSRLTLSACLFKIIRTAAPAARYDALLPSEVGYALPYDSLNKTAFYGSAGMIAYHDSIGEVMCVVSGSFT